MLVELLTDHNSQVAETADSTNSQPNGPVSLLTVVERKVLDIRRWSVFASWTFSNIVK